MYGIKEDTGLPLVEFINDYVEKRLDPIEKQVFEEYLQANSELHLFVAKSREGKKAAQDAFRVGAANDFEEKLARRISKEQKNNSDCLSA